MPRSSRLLLVLCTALLGSGLALGDDQDLGALLDGVSEISAPGIPGALCVFGDDAFVVVAGKAGRSMRQPVVAAARTGEGRIVAFGHNGYFGKGALDVADTGHLMLNAVRWLAGDAEPRVLVQGLPDLLALLREQGVGAEAVGDAPWQDKLASCNVFVTTRAPAFGAQDVAKLAEFIRSGGGFLSGDTPWGWLQLNPGKSLTADHGGNKLLAPAGLVWADGMVGRTSDAGYATDKPPPALVHAALALDAVEAHATGERELPKDDLAQAAWVVTHAARSVLPDDEIVLPRLRRLQEEHAAEAIPEPDDPLTMDQPLARLALTLQMQDIRNLPPEQVKAHPAAEFFPGAVPTDAERVARTVDLDTKLHGWHSTGLYAAPGEQIEVRVPRSAAAKGLHVRIGAHNDRLWGKDSWKRCPEMCRRFPIAAPVTKAANAFGGPVYIEVPGGCDLGAVKVEITGAVLAPHFILGKTDPVQWRLQIRDRPAPWAELEASNVILTVPSTVVRKLDNPVPLMEFWSHVADSCAELATWPLERERPERYVTDAQISAGYMHSGYPIMTHLDVAPRVVDVEDLRARGTWGHFHEMGHNHQSGDWTFGGAGEVTVNLFSLYVMDKVCGIAGGHPAVTGEQRAKKTKKHLAGGADFQQWKRDPFLALIMYAQLQEAFGWEAYKRVFAEYRALPKDQRPKNDDEKRDQWMVRFSRAVVRNLGPFFQTWGVPTSEKARASIADLPAWMPEGFPPPM